MPTGVASSAATQNATTAPALAKELGFLCYLQRQQLTGYAICKRACWRFVRRHAAQPTEERDELRLCRYDAELLPRQRCERVFLPQRCALSGLAVAEERAQRVVHPTSVSQAIVCHVA